MSKVTPKRKPKPKPAAKKTKATLSRADLLEQVRSLKRKLWVAERMRFEAVAKSRPGPKRDAWDGKLLAAGVAHEFNNILGAADGHAEWGLESGSFEDMSEALNVVRQACKRSLQITKSLQGIPSLREESAEVFALAKIAQDLKQHFRPLSKKHGVHFELDVPEVDLYGNEAQLFEVLVNLVKNAFEAMMTAKTPEATVQLIGRRVGKEQLKILVQDNGPGIPSSLRERVFHPFFTTKGRMKEMLDSTQSGAEAPKSNSSEGGSGLGLFLSQSIIQNMGGRLVHLASTQGTRFQISLPVAVLRQKRRLAKNS